MSPTTEAFVKVELPSTISAPAKACLEICEPIAGNIYTSSKHSRGYPCCNQYDPDLARIKHLLRVSEKACSVRIEVFQALTFFRIFEDPIDRGKIIIADPAPGALGIPVQS